MRRLSCIVTALAVLASCGGHEQKAASHGTPANTKPRSPVIPEALTGTWVHTFKRRDVAAAGFDPGKFVMKLKADGTLEVYFGPGAHDVSADCLTQEYCDALTATARGSVLTISETAACVETGDYRFTVHGDKLTTTKVADTCTAGRPTILGNTTWSRRPSCQSNASHRCGQLCPAHASAFASPHVDSSVAGCGISRPAAPLVALLGTFDLKRHQAAI